MGYKSVEALRVFLNFGGEQIHVGRMIMQMRRIWFEYEHGFLSGNLEISPFRLPLEAGVKHCDTEGFEGIHGVFYDSLPDGWGRLLLDRHINKIGIHPQQLTALDRLAAVGNQGMGALCYEPEWRDDAHQEAFIDLYDMEKATQDILEDVSSEQLLEALLRLNGSSQGARPKIVVSISPDKTQIRASGASPQNWEQWLIKFRSTQDLADNGPIEFAYSLMAKQAGLDMPPTHLFHDRYFGVKRFDHEGQNRHHIHTLAGLLHANYRIPNLDYTEALKATYILTKSAEALQHHFRLAAFNVLSHNRDDHSKNTSYKLTALGQWKLAPAYDLTFSFGPGGEQSMTVVGEGKNPTRKHLLTLGQRLDVQNPGTVIDQVQDAVSQWPSIANRVGVTRSSIQLISSYLML